MTDMVVTEQPTIPLRLGEFSITSAVFSESSLTEMLRSLDRHYTALKMMMTTPAVVKYDELTQLRRQSLQPHFGTNPFGRFQSQLRLALELFRLGRRSEGFRLLAQIDDRLPLNAQTPEIRNAALVYGLWLALLRAVIGDKAAARATAEQLAEHSNDPASARAVLTFFNSL